ncbi:unnamed protein product [Merluccius merluccius]
MHLSGQNFTLQAKNVRHSKTPGLHLSAAPGVGVEEAEGRLTSAARTQLDSLPLRSLAPHPDGMGGDVGPLSLRLAPLKLAPLQLPEQKQNPTGIHKVNTRTSGRVRKKVPKGPAPACASTPTAPTKDPQRPLGARLFQAGPEEPTADRPLLEDVVCRRALAPTMRAKPSPPSLSGKTPAMAALCQKPPEAAAPQETGRRRLRLRRTQHMEEGRSPDIKASGGLKPPVPAALVVPSAPQGKDQRAERALREAGRMLENAAKRDAQQHHQYPAMGLEVSGRAIRRTAATNLQDLVL